MILLKYKIQKKDDEWQDLLKILIFYLKEVKDSIYILCHFDCYFI